MRRAHLNFAAWPAAFSASATLALLALGLLPILWKGIGAGGLSQAFDAYFWRVLSFTLLQAGISTALSVIPAIAVARALHRREFPGRRLLVALLILPLTLPAIVVILGVTQVYGPNGWLGGWFQLYGLTGILIAHVFFNLTLATRLLLSRLESIPADSYRLGAQLGFTPRDVLRHIEWPAMRAALAPASLLIFLLCAASFAVVLILGGGPRAATLEVAIYQSLRLDFDPARASAMAIAQVLLCTVVVLAGGRRLLPESAMVASKGLWTKYQRTSAASTAFDAISICLIALVIVPPLAAIVVNGVSGLPAASALMTAAITSLIIGLASAAFALLLSMPLTYFGARAASDSSRRWLTLLSLSAWMLPPAVIATGWFIALLPFHFGGAATALLVVAMNALMALPFVYGGLATPVTELVARDDRLCASLGLRGFARLRLIDFPSLRAPLILAGAMAFAVSLGDLTAITLFGSGDIQTLPALIYRQMGSYRMADSAATALFLAASSFAVMCFADAWARKR